MNSIALKYGDSAKLDVTSRSSFKIKSVKKVSNYDEKVRVTSQKAKQK